MLSNVNNNTKKQLDSYSMLICSKYLMNKQDFLKLLCVCKKFEETTEKLRYNPIPITSIKLFPKIQTQYLYSKIDKKLDFVNRYEIWFPVDYDEYLNYKKDGIKCHHIKYTSKNRHQHGDTILDDINLLDESCFHGSQIKTITIPNKITSIGNYCFWNSRELTNIILPTSLTGINDRCFYGCIKLKSINIPNSIQSIGINCFRSCSQLTTINIPNSITEIWSGCFSYCITLQEIILPSSLDMLDYELFKCCYSLSKITLPTKLTSIGKSCFEECKNLTSITLPTSLKILEKDVLKIVPT